MKDRVKLWIHCLIVLLSIVAFFFISTVVLDTAIENLYAEKETVADKSFSDPGKEKGTVIWGQTLAESKNKIVIIGSSELDSPVPENPRNLFPNDKYKGNVVFSGKGYAQNAINALKLGANGDTFHGQNLVIIESLQWFAYTDIDRKPFFANFPPIQFYKFQNDDRISKENKEYICRRYLQLGVVDLYQYVGRITQGNSILDNGFSILKKLGVKLYSNEYSDADICLFSALSLSDSLVSKLAKAFFRPYWWMRSKYLSLKDRFDAYRWLCSLNELDDTETKHLDWDAIQLNAEKEGKESCTNNEIYVKDDYWNTYLKDRWDTLKGADNDSELMVSGEWDDYAFFLSVCNDLDLHPYVVAMSVNGLYYDHTGFSLEKRRELYDTVESMAKDHGIESLSLEEYEYTPYFYCDVMHLGWKGWPYVVEKVIEHYS